MVEKALSTAGLARPRRRRRSLRRRESIEGHLYISPWIIGFLCFTLVPFLMSLGLSLTSYSIIRPPQFTGLQNYTYMFTQDPLFWGSLQRTLYYAALSIPLGIIGSLLCALLLNQGLHGTSLFRTLYFLPSLTPAVSSALLWRWIFQRDFGVLNYLLGKVAIQGPGWLGEPVWAIPSLVIMSLWSSVGGNRMIIFLAGLQGVPKELYESAEIDGGTSWDKFLHITLPMISPTMFFNVILGVIGALKVFTAAYVATQGGPAYATWFYVLHLYHQAFKYARMGYASALGWVFFIIVLVLTLAQVKASRSWVFYMGEVG